jgi:NarL family two-component system response regulator LiaR
VNKSHLLQPDVIVLDLSMPRKDGLTAIGEIKAVMPQARILVLTSFAEDDKIFPALQAGALGYILKDSSPQELLQAIHAIYRGESPVNPSVARKVMDRLTQSAGSRPEDTLTDREKQVLRLVAQGLSMRILPKNSLQPNALCVPTSVVSSKNLI